MIFFYKCLSGSCTEVLPRLLHNLAGAVSQKFTFQHIDLTFPAT